MNAENLLSLKGRSILVCGIGGLGGVVAHYLADQGVSVTAVDVSDIALDALAKKDERIYLRKVNIADEQEVIDLVATVNSETEIDGLVHAVGVNPRKSVLDTTVEDWDATIQTNLRSAFLIGRELAKKMLPRKKGSMVFISSVAGSLAHKNHGVYAASKGGLNQLLRVMAHEFASSGVTVNGVAPGYINTALTNSYLADRTNYSRLVSLIPKGELGKPEDILGAVHFLLSESAQFVTGQVLNVDGGRTLV